MERASVDVLIVGAGPTGLTLAIQLARFGVSYRIIDQSPAPSDKSKALAIQSRTVELFATMGIADAAIREGLQAHAFALHTDKTLLGQVRFTDEVDTPYPYILLLPQDDTERLLLGRLTSLGGNVERTVRLTAFTQDASGVRATLRDAGGGEETISCRWLVGCDGAHSTVRHGLQLQFEGSAYQNTYWLTDLHVHWSLAHDEVHGFLGEHSSLFAFPIPEANRYRLIAQQDGATGGDPTLADLQELMDALGPAGTVLSDPVWLTTFHLHHRKVDRYGVGNAFVAGDAAHIHSPAGGQGMNTGIQDVDNLAWKLALVAHGKAGTALLESYDAERNPVAARVLRQTDLMFRAITSQAPTLRALRNRLVPRLMSRRAFARMMQRSIGELNIRYRASPIVAEEGQRGGPHAGTRAPDGPLVTPTDEQTSVWSLCRHERVPQHTLLLLSGPHPSAEDRAAFTAIRQTVQEHYRDVVATRLIAAEGAMEHDPAWEAIRYDDPDRATHRRYATKGAALFVIRPDGYIGFRSRPANPDATRAYLARIFPRVSA